jgi:signal transduction histidine kinase
VSLALSGVLTGILVQNIEFNSAKDQLAKNALLLRPLVQNAARTPTNCPVRLTNGVCPPITEGEFLTTVSELNLNGDRLVLLDRPRTVGGRPSRQPWVLYDSAGLVQPGTPIQLGKETTVSGQTVRPGTITLDGHPYLISAVPITTAYASFLVLLRSEDVVAAEANGQFARPILAGAGAGLALAIVVTLLLSRALSRPLRDLETAAEDIAGGNYSRRVRATGRDEIGVVGQAFNRMAEAVERARSQQRTFLADVSHELKTPLTSLIGFSQALTDGSLRGEEEKARAAGILHEEAQRVLRLSQELLDLARVESGQLTFDPQPVDLGAQLQQEIEIIRPRAQQRGLVLQLALPSSLPPVRADPDRVHQILENLLDNAVKYAPPETDVRVSAEEAPGGVVTTSVRNQVGWPAPDPERMFDRFYRGDPSRSATGGVGLGLAISRELAVAQQGRLTAHIEPPGSLAMRLDLPAAAPPHQARRETPARAPIRLSPRPQPRS